MFHCFLEGYRKEETFVKRFTKNATASLVDLLSQITFQSKIYAKF